MLRVLRTERFRRGSIVARREAACPSTREPICFAEVLSPYERVADRFQSMPTLTYEQLKSAVASGLTASADPQQTHTALTALQRLGFVWRPPGQLPPVRYEPGIPSLMAYVLDHAAPTHREALPETR